ncbi:hypothetical protein F7725_003747 [Dissostichus mawsoni]|uniref:Uncharacterized protein n=1 Tax=Dissostichus mawsoni TaxID=36200 RepID=A0A7J5YD17_DISMA|nr:hypothetical protein F7725_003747 [Dissostichus mawsoni]
MVLPKLLSHHRSHSFCEQTQEKALPTQMKFPPSELLDSDWMNTPDKYLRAWWGVDCLGTCWLQELSPTRWRALDCAHPILVVLCGLDPALAVTLRGLSRPRWSLGSECSVLEYLILRRPPRCCRRCWCWFGSARSNIRSLSGCCRYPSPALPVVVAPCSGSISTVTPALPSMSTLRTPALLLRFGRISPAGSIVPAALPTSSVCWGFISFVARPSQSLLDLDLSLGGAAGVAVPHPGPPLLCFLSSPLGTCLLTGELTSQEVFCRTGVCPHPVLERTLGSTSTGGTADTTGPGGITVLRIPPFDCLCRRWIGLRSSLRFPHFLQSGPSLQ